MENRDFFDTIIECIASKDLPWMKSGLDTYVSRCGYNADCLDTYDDTVEYRRIFLSHYYHSAVWDDELDFDGKPFGPPGGDDTIYHMEAIMGKRESVKQYIRCGSLTWNYYHQLVEKYNLVT